MPVYDSTNLWCWSILVWGHSCQWNVEEIELLVFRNWSGGKMGDETLSGSGGYEETLSVQRFILSRLNNGSISFRGWANSRVISRGVFEQPCCSHLRCISIGGTYVTDLVHKISKLLLTLLSSWVTRNGTDETVPSVRSHCSHQE